MTLNGIDISNYQAGINLASVPADFVIIKATEGTWYTNPVADTQYQGAKSAGRKLGVYHFADGSGAIEEAKYFLSKIQGYLGEAILVLDWEADAITQGVAYAKTFLDYVYNQTGIRPMIYMSKSTANAYDWRSVSANYGLWVAQYATDDTTGYQDDPWTDSTGYGSWTAPAMFQYTSHGRLGGYDGNLDLNLFYGNKTAWDAYAKSDKDEPVSDKPPLEQLKDYRYIAFTFDEIEWPTNVVNYLVASNDGINWTQIKKYPELAWRDPSIYKAGDVFYIAYTGGLAMTTDWVTITKLGTPLEKGNQWTWAPEFFESAEGVKLVYSRTQTAGNDQTFKLFMADFNTGTGAVTNLDQAVNVELSQGSPIDPNINYVNGTYYLWVREKDLKLRLYSAKSVRGTYKEITTNLSAVQGYTMNEAPEMLKIGDKWFLYSDPWSSAGVRYESYVTSTDMKTWSTYSKVKGLNFSPRHWGVLDLGATDVDPEPETGTNIVQYADPDGNRAYAYTHWDAVEGKPAVALKSDIPKLPDLSGYAKKSDIPSSVSLKKGTITTTADGIPNIAYAYNDKMVALSFRGQLETTATDASGDLQIGTLPSDVPVPWATIPGAIINVSSGATTGVLRVYANRNVYLNMSGAWTKGYYEGSVSYPL